MTSFAFERDGVALLVDTLLRLHEGGDGLESDAYHELLAGRDAALDSSAVVGDGFRLTGGADAPSVIVRGTYHVGALEARPDLHAFDGGQTPKRMCKAGLKFVEDRFAQARWDSGSDQHDAATDGVAGSARCFDVRLHCIRGSCMRAARRMGVDGFA